MASEVIRRGLEATGALIMKACNAVNAYFFDRRIMTYTDLKSLDNVAPPIQDLLKYVYSVLFLAALAAALGMKLFLPFHIGVKIILSVGCFTGCRYGQPENNVWDMSFMSPSVSSVLGNYLLLSHLLLATAFSFGAFIGSLTHGTNISKGIMIFVELVCTIFSCFIAGATLPNRIDMYATAVSSSSMKFVSWLISASDGHPINYVQIFSVAVSFILLLLYVVVYSQDLVAQARAQHGHVNFAQHAVYFFSDFLAIFVHVVVISIWRSFRRGNGGNGGNGGDGGNGGRGTHPRSHPGGE